MRYLILIAILLCLVTPALADIDAAVVPESFHFVQMSHAQGFAFLTIGSDVTTCANAVYVRANNRLVGDTTWTLRQMVLESGCKAPKFPRTLQTVKYPY